MMPLPGAADLGAILGECQVILLQCCHHENYVI